MFLPAVVLFAFSFYTPRVALPGFASLGAARPPSPYASECPASLQFGSTCHFAPALGFLPLAPLPSMPIGLLAKASFHSRLFYANFPILSFFWTLQWCPPPN